MNFAKVRYDVDAARLNTAIDKFHLNKNITREDVNLLFISLKTINYDNDINVWRVIQFLDANTWILKERPELGDSLIKFYYRAVDLVDLNKHNITKHLTNITKGRILRRILMHRNDNDLSNFKNIVQLETLDNNTIDLSCIIDSNVYSLFLAVISSLYHQNKYKDIAEALFYHSYKYVTNDVEKSDLLMSFVPREVKIKLIFNYYSLRKIKQKINKLRNK